MNSAKVWCTRTSLPRLNYTSGCRSVYGKTFSCVFSVIFLDPLDISWLQKPLVQLPYGGLNDKLKTRGWTSRPFTSLLFVPGLCIIDSTYVNYPDAGCPPWLFIQDVLPLISHQIICRNEIHYKLWFTSSPDNECPSNLAPSSMNNDK